MSRVQLALNVNDLDEAVDFYSKLFNTEPFRRHDDYANFVVADPPMKLVLFENAAEPGSLNHLGVEVESAEEVEAAEARLRAEELATTGVDDRACCYATKTETWVEGPEGHRWEWYVRTGDHDKLTNKPVDREMLSVGACGPGCC